MVKNKKQLSDKEEIWRNNLRKSVSLVLKIKHIVDKCIDDLEYMEPSLGEHEAAAKLTIKWMQKSLNNAKEEIQAVHKEVVGVKQYKIEEDNS